MEEVSGLPMMGSASTLDSAAAGGVALESRTRRARRNSGSGSRKHAPVPVSVRRATGSNRDVMSGGVKRSIDRCFAVDALEVSINGLINQLIALE